MLWLSLAAQEKASEATPKHAGRHSLNAAGLAGPQSGASQGPGDGRELLSPGLGLRYHRHLLTANNNNNNGPREPALLWHPHLVVRVPQVRHGRREGGGGERGALRRRQLHHRVRGQHPLLRQRQPRGRSQRHR